VSTTKSTSRVRSRQKKRLPVRPPRVRDPEAGRKQTSPRPHRPPAIAQSFLGPNIQQSAKQAGVSEIEFGALDDRLRSIREPRFEQYDLTGGFQYRQPMVRS
jgi:hypothetical protein